MTLTDGPATTNATTPARPRHTRSGRPCIGAAIVEKIKCGPQAKQRLRMLVATLTQEYTVEQASRILGISRARMHQLRDEWMIASTSALEPKPKGLRPRVLSDEARENRRLAAENQRLQRELLLAQERAKLASALGRSLPAVRPVRGKD